MKKVYSVLHQGLGGYHGNILLNIRYIWIYAWILLVSIPNCKVRAVGEWQVLFEHKYAQRGAY